MSHTGKHWRLHNTIRLSQLHNCHDWREAAGLPNSWIPNREVQYREIEHACIIKVSNTRWWQHTLNEFHSHGNVQQQPYGLPKHYFAKRHQSSSREFIMTFKRAQYERLSYTNRRQPWFPAQIPAMILQWNHFTFQPCTLQKFVS